MYIDTWSLDQILEGGGCVGDSNVTVGLPGLLALQLGGKDLASLARRFSRRPLLSGPCMLIERHSGLALDSTADPEHKTRPVLWTPHGLPWQQWRIEKAGRQLIRITSVRSGLVLSTDRSCGDGSWVWQERDRDRVDQRWRLLPMKDRTAFVIETADSAHALDATTDPDVPASREDRSTNVPSSPILWSTHGAPWQQWIILRLPLTEGAQEGGGY